MKKLTPKLLIAALSLVLCTLIALPMNAAQAEKLTLTFASTTPPKSNLEIASKRFVDTIAAKTQGRIEIKHYGTGSLYNAKTIMPAISKDQVDIGILHVALVGRRSPVLEFIGSFGAQGCWKDNSHYFKFLDNPKTRAIASNEFEKFFNSKLLAPLTFGTGLMGRRDKSITKVADFKGLKMRTSGTAQATMYKALGAVPVGLSSKEIYTALQRGTIQGATSGVARWRRSKLYEVAPYLTVDPTLPYLSMWLVINNKAWAKLSKTDQNIVMESAKEMEQWTRDFAKKETKDDMAFLKKEAKSLYDLSLAEKTLLIDTVKPAMKDFAKGQLKDRFEELWGLLENSK
ncbi:MAG: TRAP transporter substrate-binding protein [Desulfobacteraceae bacterium]|nr:TRAP transporter substrate-binding protein [Desulfobacteraceae bacterium]